MLQFGSNSFISIPQAIEGREEIEIGTEFTLDVLTIEAASKLLAINLHQMKEGSNKRSKVVGRSTKMGLPKIEGNEVKQKTIKIFFFENTNTMTLSQTSFNPNNSKGLHMGLHKKNSSVESLLSVKSDA